MKKLILFLLLPLWAMAQTTTGQEQEFDYGIKNNSTQTITTPPYLTTTGMDGTQGKIPSALIEKTDNKQNSLAVDGTGTKYPTVDAVNAALPKTYTTTVYVDTNDPNTATIFDDENPPTVNDDGLKSNTDNLYIGLDASAWVYNGITYVTKIVPASSNFYINSTSIDAGNSKDVDINRIGSISTSRYIAAGSGLVSRLGSSNIENLGSYLRLANKVGSENNQFQLNASNGVDLWNYSSGVWNKRFTFSSDGNLRVSRDITLGNETGMSTLVFGGGVNYNGSASYDYPSRVFSLNSGFEGALVFRGIFNEFSRFTDSGNLLINTVISNGVDKLQVNGSTKTTALTLSTTPTTSSGTYDFVTRNTTTGALEKVSSNTIATTASPSFTGTPTAPTAAVGTTGNQITTVDYVRAAVSVAAQWTKTGNDIINNNTGLVSIKEDATLGKISFKSNAGLENAYISGGRFQSNAGIGVGGSLINSTTGENLQFVSRQGNVTASQFIFKPTHLSWDALGGHTHSVIDQTYIINPTSGNVNFNMQLLSPTINQTGGANGITRGIYINPTLTSAFDFRAIEVTAGKVIVPVTVETAVQEYADNAAALSAGLAIGTHYRTGDLLKIVH